MGFRIRRAVPQDSAAVRRLMARSLLGHGPEVGHSERLEVALDRVVGRDWEPFAKGTFFLVEQGARVLGIGGYAPAGRPYRVVDRKNCPYEECIRVPFWVRAPGMTARSDTNLVANIDLAPTIAAWAGVTPPGKVNGMNLLPLLESPFTPWRSSVLVEHTGGSTATNSSGVRTSRYVYNEYKNGDKELYDLVLDPYQRNSTTRRPPMRR